MPFARDTCVVPSNSVIIQAPVLPREGEISGIGIPSSQWCYLMLNYSGPCYLSCQLLLTP